MARMILITISVIAMTLTASGEYVTAESGLRLREEPSLESSVLEIVPYATEVSGEIEDGWMRTSDGYLSAKFLSDTDPLLDAQYLGTWRVTAYAETGFRTASGEWPVVGRTVATNDLPFGSLIYISGVGVRCVEDRGPTYLGSEWCDLFLGDTNACIAWGDQRLDIYLL